MSAHELQPAEHVKDAQGRTVFRAACSCMGPGLHLYAARLQHLYTKHEKHTADAQARARAAHPTGWAARRMLDDLTGGRP